MNWFKRQWNLMLEGDDYNPPVEIGVVVIWTLIIELVILGVFYWWWG